MALADPQSVTISGTAISLPRTGLALNEGGFSSADRQTLLSVQHTAGKRTRHIVKLQSQAVVSDPLVPAQNIPVAYQAHLVVDLPNQGVTAAQAAALAKALVAWATDANLAKVIGGES